MYNTKKESWERKTGKKKAWRNDCDAAHSWFPLILRDFISGFFFNIENEISEDVLRDDWIKMHIFLFSGFDLNL